MPKHSRKRQKLSSVERSALGNRSLERVREKDDEEKRLEQLLFGKTDQFDVLASSHNEEDINQEMANMADADVRTTLGFLELRRFIVKLFCRSSSLTKGKVHLLQSIRQYLPSFTLGGKLPFGLTQMMQN